MNRIGSTLLLFLAALAAAPISDCSAQRPQIVGIAMHPVHATPNLPSAQRSSERFASDGQSHLGTWIVVGALVGAVGMGTWAAIEISKSDDPMLAGPMFGYAVGIGAVIGGATGAFAYLISHSPHARSEPFR